MIYYLLGSLLVTILFFITVAFKDTNVEKLPLFVKQFLTIVMVIITPQYFVWNYFEPTMTKNGRILLVTIVTMLILPVIILGMTAFIFIVILILLTACLLWLWQGYCWLFRKRNI